MHGQQNKTFAVALLTILNNPDLVSGKSHHSNFGDETATIFFSQIFLGPIGISTPPPFPKKKINSHHLRLW
jgi:hypothetical protein